MPDVVLVVDPAWLPEEVAEIRAFVDSIKKDKILLLLITHSDYDHLFGYGAFLDAFLYCTAALLRNPKSDEIKEEMRKFDDEYYIKRSYNLLYPDMVRGFFLMDSIDDATAEMGGVQFYFYHAKGHNPDGMMMAIEPYGILIVGDYLCDVEFPYIYHSSDEYLKTLDRIDHIIEKHKIKWLISGHGNPTNRKEEIYKRHENALTYIHQLRECIAEGREFDLKGYMKYHGYQFPRIMEKYHKDNITLMKKELKAKIKK